MNHGKLELTGERLLTSFVNEDTTEHLHRYAIAAQLALNKDVLDVASGEGYGSNLLSNHAKTVVGVDISFEAVNHAAEKYTKNNLKFVHGSATEIPIKSSSIDVVTSFETLEHHDKHEEMFQEIKRILRANGLLIISTPDKLFYSDIPKYHNKYHIRELYLDELRALATKFFKNVRIYFQETILASIITPETNHPGLDFFKGSHDRIDPAQKTLPHHKYILCIAGDEDIPELGNSLFEIPSIIEDYRSRPSLSELHHFKNALGNAQKELADLRSSSSFRFGRALTWPLRALRIR